MKTTEKIPKYGSVTSYKKNDIVVWRGIEPCIGKIKHRQTNDKDCWVISESHNSLHYSNLRPATKAEKKRLGRKRILPIASAE